MMVTNLARSYSILTHAMMIIGYIDYPRKEPPKGKFAGNFPTTVDIEAKEVPEEMPEAQGFVHSYANGADE